MGKRPCCIVKDVKKGSWTAEEDQKLLAYVQEHGEGGWRSLPVKAGLQRCGKSCRLRWTNYLRPGIKRGSFTHEEEETIIKLHAQLGNRWAAIARQLPKRTDNEIKNYWNAHIKKRLPDKVADPAPSKPATPRDDQDSRSAVNQPEQQPLSKPHRLSWAQLLNRLASKFKTLQSLDKIKSWLDFGLPDPSDSDDNDGDHTNDVMEYNYTSESSSGAQENSSSQDMWAVSASEQLQNHMTSALAASNQSWDCDFPKWAQQFGTPACDGGVSDGIFDVGSPSLLDSDLIEALLSP